MGPWFGHGNILRTSQSRHQEAHGPADRPVPTSNRVCFFLALRGLCFPQRHMLPPPASPSSHQANNQHKVTSNGLEGRRHTKRSHRVYASCRSGFRECAGPGAEGTGPRGTTCRAGEVNAQRAHPPLTHISTVRARADGAHGGGNSQRTARAPQGWKCHSRRGRWQRMHREWTLDGTSCARLVRVTLTVSTAPGDPVLPKGPGMAWGEGLTARTWAPAPLRSSQVVVLWGNSRGCCKWRSLTLMGTTVNIMEARRPSLTVRSKEEAT